MIAGGAKLSRGCQPKEKKKTLNMMYVRLVEIPSKLSPTTANLGLRTQMKLILKISYKRSDLEGGGDLVRVPTLNGW